ncbi:MAG: TonB family protein [Mojavia pulchra JT2-VF2]|jgi:TonB family protein|uniref:TonB family protein n=1 Tax=Mojavia pulchra JT2-VF2 TaxID=287848 RepID=A0A951Q3S3_9NOST|nr:TonB family protein [Mojavia pulchra JT2-VF2]
MAFSDECHRYRSLHPAQIIFCLVTSILLHSTLLMVSKYWLKAFMPEPKQEIPIEVVEVFPNQTHIPPKTSFRATKDSIAGGKALPKRPVSAVLPRDAHRASSKSPSDLSPVKVFQPGTGQQKAELPNSSSQQPKPQKTKSASATRPPALKPKAVAPTTLPTPTTEPTALTRLTRPPVPKPKAVAPTTLPTPTTEPTALTRVTRPPVPKPKAVAPTTLPTPTTEPTALTRVTRPPAPKPQKIAVAPTTPPAPKIEPTAHNRAITSPVPNPNNLIQPGTRLSGRTPSQTRPSHYTGAAGLLGGTVSVSSRNFSGDNLAASPNSNRDRKTTSGIDAQSQDIDITSYLNQLRQRVKQQWLPGMSQSDRRTVLNFSVNRSGQLSNLQFAQTSGFSLTDQAALNAIQRAAPFAPLPTGYPNKYIHIQFTFDINVYGELNLSGDGG